jgi:hypothetical protein
MKWALDKLALLLCSVVCAVMAWAAFRFGGQWVFSAMLAITLVGLFAENSRLKRVLREHGIDPRRFKR